MNEQLKHEFGHWTKAIYMINGSYIQRHTNVTNCMCLSSAGPFMTGERWIFSTIKMWLMTEKSYEVGFGISEFPCLTEILLTLKLLHRPKNGFIRIFWKGMFYSHLSASACVSAAVLSGCTLRQIGFTDPMVNESREICEYACILYNSFVRYKVKLVMK